MNEEVRYPHIKNEEQILKDVCHQRFRDLYEEQLCVKFQNRLDEELQCIASLHISGVFLIFKELFERLGWKEYEHGFRGTIGSSLVAYLCGLTDTDPLREDIPLYPAFCFGYDFDRNPYFDFLIPTGRVEGLCKVLTQIEGVAAVVPAQLENGQGHVNAMYLIPEGEEIPYCCKYNAAPYLQLRVSESKQIDFLVRMVEITGINPSEIDMEDSNILRMYKNTDDPDMMCIGNNIITALGLPEVRTLWMANLLYETRKQVKSFADLVRVDCLSHSTITWSGNGEGIVAESGEFDLEHIITCREDVYEYGIHFGVSPYHSFRIAESVRKGRGVTIDDCEEAEFNELCQLPEWFIDVCLDIKYLFSRAHCYHMMLLSWRCAFFRYYYPMAFYQAYFEVMADDDISRTVFDGQEAYSRLKGNFVGCELDYQEEYRIDFAVADELYYRGYTAVDCQANVVCPGKFLLREIIDAARENKLAEFRREWQKSNLEIYEMDVFRGKQATQEELVLLIEQLEMDGFRITFHMDDIWEGYETLFEGIKSKISNGHVTVKRRKEGKLGEIVSFADTKTAMDELMSRLTDKNWFKGVKTGFDNLDERTGGFGDEQLIVLGGRPAMGKTALAINILRNVAIINKVPSVYFSLDLPKTEILRRLLYLRAERKLQADSMITEEKVANVFTPPAEEISNSPLLVLDEYRKIDDIVEKCHSLKKDYGIRFIVIDYLQLIGGNQELVRNEELGEVTRKLKRLAQCMGCPVLVLSQISRNVEHRPDHRPMLSDLLDCSEMEYLADEVLFLYRDDYYHPDTEQAGTAELAVAKHSLAPTGVILLEWASEFYKFYDPTGHVEIIEGEEEVLDLETFASMVRKKVFTCGVGEELQRKISYNIGLCEMTDVTDHLTDVFALQADVVVVNTDVVSEDDVKLIREYELDVDDSSVKYYYLSEKELERIFDS
jgi:replicative DNA helicase